MTNVIGGVGIWVSIILAECIPVLFYIIYTVKLQKTHESYINKVLMLQNSKLVTWTYHRKDIGKVDKYLDSQSKEVLLHIENVHKDDAIILSNSIDDVCEDIFRNNEDLQSIDIAIRAIEDELYIIFTDDGKIYNPFSNKTLMKTDNIVNLSKLGYEFNYEEILGFNKEYILLKN